VSESLAAPVLVLDPSGAGATRWADCVPGRRDLPRTRPEMPLLGITPHPAEPDEDDVPAGAWCYHRTRRSGQGRLTGRETLGLLVVLISAKRPDDPEAARELRDWGDFVHLNHIAAVAVPGFTMITPYEIGGDGPTFLHLYEMEDDDAETCFQDMPRRVRQRLTPGEYAEWAMHPQLLIEYVSTYRRIE
jgi:hypothetical protein